jgi:signal transduction histidine kinase/CheY-like chemotaxis protein
MQLPGSQSSIKGKIVIAFLISFIALAGSYWVNKTAFWEIHKSVEDLSSPNKKLIVVNNIFTEINETEKIFRDLVSSDNGRSLKAFTRHSKTMVLLADSLGKLCADNPHQVSLIDSINNLLKVREHLLLNYAEFRRVLKSNNDVLEQTKLLDSIITINTPKVDSTVLTNERNNVITKIDSVEIQAPEEEKRGFWKKLFKASKKEPKRIRQIIRQEINTKVDTVLHTRTDDVTEQVQKIINDIVAEQQARRKKFFKHESQLAVFENSFNTKITSLLSEVNKDILHKTATTYSSAEGSINRSINRIFVIMLIFIVATGIIAFLMLTDVTKSNRYKLLLEQANEETHNQSLSRQRFLSNMSHEIRTPLQSIIGYTEQMTQQEIPNKNYIKAVQTSSEHLLSVINEILDYNRIISGIFTFEKIDFDIKKVVNEVISILKFPAEQKGLELVYHDDEISTNYLNGDPFRLKQVLLNLLGNAIKFTEKGRVTLRISSQFNGNKEVYEFIIEDTGIGIPKDMLEIIFNRFERVNLPLEQRYSGTGLGLGIVKALVEGQGGTIRAMSDQGLGSRFTFHIPYDKGHKVETDASVSFLEVNKFEGLVWLVDDDKWILNLCHDILSKHHINHQSFNAPEDLLNASYTTEPALVLIDIRMPGINGLQLFDRIKHKFSAATKFIALTAQALPEERAEILEHGFDGILLKPFREQELMLLFKMKAKPNDIQASSSAFSGWDRGVLQRMLNDDDVTKILRQYLLETKNDIALLEDTLMAQNAVEASVLLHRISGRTSQIGAKELGTVLRKLEIEIHNHQVMDEAEIQSAIEKMKALMIEIEASC